VDIPASCRRRPAAAMLAWDTHDDRAGHSVVFCSRASHRSLAHAQQAYAQKQASMPTRMAPVKFELLTDEEFGVRNPATHRCAPLRHGC
jgi:hypothetical protein